jgi:ABC-2 type transport system permease protein
MRALVLIFRREFAAYFATPLAAVFLAVFVGVSTGMTFFVSNFFDRSQADLSSFFTWQPWLLLVLMPAVGMRLWAEERRLGTIELLMTLPVQPWKIVLSKWLAAFAFAGLALAFTMPLWITVNWLGSPDNGVILASYLGAWLMAGAFLAVGACISSTSKSQVIAFVSCVVACFLLLLTGFPAVQDFFNGWAPRAVVEAVSSMSVLTHFDSMVRGVLDARDLLYFVSVMVAFLFMNALLIDWKKAL